MGTTGYTLGIDIGQKHVGVCVWDPDTTSIRRWAVWSSEGSWAPEIWACLQTNATPDFLQDVDTVVIEHQPSKNPTMTRIMHYIEFFFVSKGFEVRIQDSKHKLLYASTTPWFPDNCTDAEWTYRTRKKLAIQCVHTFCRDTQQEHLEFFESSKKKDDLADAALHAMAYHGFKKTTDLAARTTKHKPPTKIISRPPSHKQERTGRYSPHNVRYFLKEAGTDPETIRTTLKTHPARVTRAFKRHFGDVDGYIRAIANLKPDDTV